MKLTVCFLAAFGESDRELISSGDYAKLTVFPATQGLPLHMGDFEQGFPEYLELYVRSSPNANPPAIVTSPFSTLWPNGSIPRIGVSEMQIANLIPPIQGQSHQDIIDHNYLQLVESLYPYPSRRLQGEDRFGNFLHTDLSAESKRQIWNKFLADSRRATSTEEQNELIRQLENNKAVSDDHAKQFSKRNLRRPSPH